MEIDLKYDKLMHTYISLTKYLADKVHGNAFWLNVLSKILNKNEKTSKVSSNPLETQKIC